MNAEAHTWKACWGQPLRSSNLLSSATLTCRNTGSVAGMRGLCAGVVSIRGLNYGPWAVPSVVGLQRRHGRGASPSKPSIRVFWSQLPHHGGRGGRRRAGGGSSAAESRAASTAYGRSGSDLCSAGAGTQCVSSNDGIDQQGSRDFEGFVVRGLAVGQTPFGDPPEDRFPRVGESYL